MPLRLVVIGASLNGLPALQTLLAALPARFAAALIIVLHRSRRESGHLLSLLAPHCALPLGFPRDKEHIDAGQVYIAPPDYHLLIESDHFAFSLDPPEHFARPSIDVLFASAAEAYGARVTGIVLTGTGVDGVQGLATIYRYGGQAIVQAPGEAAAPELPLNALAATPEALQLPLDAMGAQLAKLTCRTRGPR